MAASRSDLPSSCAAQALHDSRPAIDRDVGQHDGACDAPRFGWAYVLIFTKARSSISGIDLRGREVVVRRDRALSAMIAGKVGRGVGRDLSEQSSKLLLGGSAKLNEIAIRP